MLSTIARRVNSVVLRARGKNNVFLTGPLTLHTGVTLVIGKNTALVASRDPHLYEISPASCGIVSQRGHGCKPLITGTDIKNAGIMGQGSIDARGGATLLGQNVTWWDLAHEAKVKDEQQSVPVNDRHPPCREFHALQHHAPQFTRLSRFGE